LKVIEILGGGGGDPRPTPPRSSRGEGFTDRVRRVFDLAEEEARTLRHNYIGTEHILLGLIREGEGVAAQILVRLGADLTQTRQQIIEILSGDQGSMSVPRANAPPVPGTGPHEASVPLAADPLAGPPSARGTSASGTPSSARPADPAEADPAEDE
jgi:hypothetical protein